MKEEMYKLFKEMVPDDGKWYEYRAFIKKENGSLWVSDTRLIGVKEVNVDP